MSAPDREEAGRAVAAGRLTITVAAHAGYCYGVERALRLTDEALERHGPPIATLGPIIHNPGVVDELAARGVAAVADVEQVAGGTLVVRTHGVPPEVVERARGRGLRVVDATCPFVTVAQRKASALARRGYVVVVLGERDHPEVIGLAACAGEDAVIVEDAAQLDVQTIAGRRVGVVVQTTQTRENLSRLVAAITPLARETLVYNTVCEATERRQEAARALARDVDLVVVVGGRNSANTTRLAEICRAIQPRTVHIERADELRDVSLRGVRRIGVTAGASTPDAEIDAAVATLEEFALSGDEP
jgi:4-hydroxy-3-methylbut-2-enyl diphosphate reductase